MILVAAAIWLAGDYQPPAPAPQPEASAPALACGPGTFQLSDQCVGAPQISAPPVIVQQPSILVPTGYGFDGGFGFRHFRR
jgi:hypothetical protein